MTLNFDNLLRCKLDGNGKENRILTISWKTKLFENSWVYFVRPLRKMEVLQVLRAGHCCEYSKQGRLRKNKYHIKQKP